MKMQTRFRITPWLCTVFAVALVALPAFGRSHRATRSKTAEPAKISVSTPKTATKNTAAANGKSEIKIDGEYNSKNDVAQYIRQYGKLPRNFITKNEARKLGWSGGPLEPFAPGKSIGGDHFGNYENKLPEGRYKECDIDTRGRARGAKRIIYSTDKRLYYTADHYNNFEKIP